MRTAKMRTCLAAILFAAAGEAQTSTTGYRVVGASITGASEVNQVIGKTQSKLELNSSDARLVEGFVRARRQAVAYVFDNDPVGPWYQPPQPRRETFCL